MEHSLKHELRSLVPSCLGCVLLPLPAIAFWRSGDGRRVALWLFFIGCTSLVALAFRHDVGARVPEEVEYVRRRRHRRLAAVAVALLGVFLVFSLLCLTLNDSHDLVAVFLAFTILVPSFCVVPYLMLALRKPFVAVVLALVLVGCMKLLGGLVVVLVYGWHASEHGYTTMPWMRPNLLVWVFWLFAGLLSLSFCLLSARRFQAIYPHAEAGTPPDNAPTAPLGDSGTSEGLPAGRGSSISQR